MARSTFDVGGAPRRWRWTALTLVGIVAIVIAFWTSQGRRPTAVDTPVPPFDRPALADAFPSTDDLSRWAGTHLTLVLARVPDVKTFTSSSPIANDVRHSTVDEAWWQRWESANSPDRVDIEAWRMNWSRLTTRLRCEPEQLWPVPGMTRAGVTSVGPDGTIACLILDRGVTHVRVEAVVTGNGHTERARAAIERVAATLDAQVPDLQKDPPARVSMPTTHSLLLLTWMVAMIGVGIATTAPSALSDRSTRRRLTSRFRRRWSHPTHLDLEPHARLAISRGQALGVLRFAAVLWGLRLAEEIPLGSFETAALVAGVYLLGIAGQRMILARTLRSTSPRTLRGPVLLLTLAGALAAGLVAWGAAYLWMGGVTLTAGGTLGAMIPDWQAQGIGFLLILGSLWVFALAVVPLKFGRQLARKVSRTPVPDGRPPTLLLRNFTDDSLTLRARRLDRASLVDHLLMRRKENFEEVLAFSLAKLGHPFAVGRPGELLPPALGATRLYFDDNHWQTAVRRIADDAALVCVAVGRSEWLVWEMQFLLQEGLLHKTVFVLPPLPPTEQRKRLAVLASVLGVPWPQFETRGTGRDVLAVCWPLGLAQPLVVVSAAQDDQSYDLALAHCAQALTEVSGAELLAPRLLPEEAPVPSGRPVDVPVDASAAPPVEILPPGTSKARKSLWRNPWVINAAINVIVVPFLLPLATGEPLGQRDTQTIAQPAGSGHWLVGASADRVWYLVEGNRLFAQSMADKDPPSPEELGTLPAPVAWARMVDGVLFAQVRPPGSDAALIAWDVSERRTLFTAPTPELSHGIVVGERFIYVSQADARQILAFDRRTGEAGRTASVACRPWAAGVAGSRLFVACPEEDHAVSLDADTLSEPEAVAVPRGTTSVLTWKDQPWFLSPLESKLVSPEDPTTWWLPQANPAAAASGDVLAVQGVERVTVLTGNAVTRRQTFLDVSNIVVAPSGQVAFTDTRGIVFFKKP